MGEIFHSIKHTNIQSSEGSKIPPSRLGQTPSGPPHPVRYRYRRPRPRRVCDCLTQRWRHRPRSRRARIRRKFGSQPESATSRSHLQQQRDQVRTYRSGESWWIHGIGYPHHHQDCERQSNQGRPWHQQNSQQYIQNALGPPSERERAAPPQSMHRPKRASAGCRHPKSYVNLNIIRS